MAFKVLSADWGKDKHRLSKLRERVFVCEWHIPVECEFDHLDGTSYHILIVNEQNIEIATARITPNGEIGRIAVIPKYRKQAVYRALCQGVLNAAAQLGLQELSVHCELEGVEYYSQQGFRPVGNVYMDAGIARQKMSCTIHDFCLPRVELTH